jgi:hypothetical protein
MIHTIKDLIPRRSRNNGVPAGREAFERRPRESTNPRHFSESHAAHRKDRRSGHPAPEMRARDFASKKTGSSGRPWSRFDLAQT